MIRGMAYVLVLCTCSTIAASTLLSLFSRDKSSAMPSFAPDAIEVLQPILSELDSLSIRSTCFSAATSDILGGCRSLASDLDDNRRGRYAVALTLCELSSAGVQIPMKCQYTHTEDSLRRCLSTLETRSQWWTSFSGYYRDVTRICHATRTGNEPIWLLDLHRNLTHVTSSLLRVLQEQFQSATRQSAQHSSAFRQTEEFRTQMTTWMDDMIISATTIAESRSNMRDEFQIGLNETLQLLYKSSAQQLELHSSDLRSYFTDLRRRDEGIVQDVITHYTATSTMISDRTTEDLEIWSAAARRMSASMETLQAMIFQWSKQSLELHSETQNSSQHIITSLAVISQEASNLHGMISKTSSFTNDVSRNISELDVLVGRLSQDLSAHRVDLNTMHNTSMIMLDSLSLHADAKIQSLLKIWDTIEQRTLQYRTTDQTFILLVCILILSSSQRTFLLKGLLLVILATVGNWSTLWMFLPIMIRGLLAWTFVIDQSAPVPTRIVVCIFAIVLSTVTCLLTSYQLWRTRNRRLWPSGKSEQCSHLYTMSTTTQRGLVFVNMTARDFESE